MQTLIIIFFIILALNLIPAFSPPSWMVLSYISILYKPNWLLLATTGAIAATTGRVLLAKLSHVIVRNKVLSQTTIENLDNLSAEMRKRKTLTWGIFLLYAFGPLPSNQLFIAYGLTGLSLRLIVLPFFIGRFASYAFWIVTASEISNKLIESFNVKNLFTGYFIVGQIVTLFLVYLFAKIDWQKLFTEKKLRLIKKVERS
jgi:membrane protein YqaA with SNARE-associated domain